MRISLNRFFEYADAVNMIVNRFRQAKQARVGDTVEVPETKTKVGKQRWVIDAHIMRRVE